jgi:hypothetical protein
MNTTQVTNIPSTRNKHESPAPDGLWAASSEALRAAAVFGPPPIVKDSIIEDYMGLARRYSEAEDQILVGAFQPVVGGALGRNVFINFGQRIFPNLYHVIVAKPGLRKSTTIDLVTHIARSLLPKERRSSSASQAFNRFFWSTWRILTSSGLSTKMAS